MEFLQPYLLWGGLAVTIPVIIHFWHQKKGKTIAWAATQWLTPKTSLQHRGLRLDEIPLLLIRCLLVMLLVLLLSKPVAGWLKAGQTSGKIHLVEPNPVLASEFRFELESAIKKGEKVYWIAPEPLEVKDVSVVPKIENARLYLQRAIHNLNGPGKEMNLYVTNKQSLTELPKIYIPGTFKIFPGIDSSQNIKHRYLDLGNGKILMVNQQQGESEALAVIKTTADRPGLSLASEPVHRGKIHVLIDFANAAEQQTVQAALLALTEVYAIPFTIDSDQKSDINYDWIFTDKRIKDINPTTLYIVSAKSADHYQLPNVIQVQDSLRLGTSEMVQSGTLPEWLGKMLITHYRLKENKNLLSRQQLNALFIPVKTAAAADALYKWLLLFFITTLLLERWIALRKTASQTYA